MLVRASFKPVVYIALLLFVMLNINRVLSTTFQAQSFQKCPFGCQNLSFSNRHFVWLNMLATTSPHLNHPKFVVDFIWFSGYTCTILLLGSLPFILHKLPNLLPVWTKWSQLEALKQFSNQHRRRIKFMQNCVPRASFHQLNKFTGEVSRDKIPVMFTDLDHLLVIGHNWWAIQLKHNWYMELKECKEISLPGHNTSVVSTLTTVQKCKLLRQVQTCMGYSVYLINCLCGG